MRDEAASERGGGKKTAGPHQGEITISSIFHCKKEKKTEIRKEQGHIQICMVPQAHRVNLQIQQHDIQK